MQIAEFTFVGKLSKKKRSIFGKSEWRGKNCEFEGIHERVQTWIAVRHSKIHDLLFPSQLHNVHILCLPWISLAFKFFLTNIHLVTSCRKKMFNFWWTPNFPAMCFQRDYSRSKYNGSFIFVSILIFIFLCTISFQNENIS